MREGIGSIALYNIIIIFLALTFAILAGTMSYSKAFKTNNRIINAIEMYEGYNEKSASKIDFLLSGIGYEMNEHGKCKERNGVEPMNDLNHYFHFCVYATNLDTRTYKGRYVRYGVVTYIHLDIPFLGQFIKIPVYGQSNRIFCFGEKCSKYVNNLE